MVKQATEESKNHFSIIVYVINCHHTVSFPASVFNTAAALCILIYLLMFYFCNFSKTAGNVFVCVSMMTATFPSFRDQFNKHFLVWDISHVNESPPHMPFGGLSGRLFVLCPPYCLHIQLRGRGPLFISGLFGEWGSAGIAVAE